MNDFLEAVQINVIEKLQFWFESFAEMLPNVVLALIVLLVFYGLARLSARSSRKVLPRMIKRHELVMLLSTTVFVVVFSLGIFIALGLLNLDKTVTSLLAGVGVLGLALGFAFQDTAANFVSGVMIAFRSPYQVGDAIQHAEYDGNVHSINLRTTIIQTFDGQLIHVPNKDMFQKPLTNFSSMQYRRVVIDVGVGYDSDLNHVESILRDALHSFNEHPTNEVDVHYSAFGSSSIDFQVRFWVKVSGGQYDYLSAKSEAIKVIKRVLDQAKVDIPFPIRTVHLHKA